MNTPNFSDLLRINQYLVEIEELSTQLSSIKQKLEETQKYYEDQLKVEKHRIKQNILQSKLLEKISQELEDLRKKEFNFSTQIKSKISQSIDSFFLIFGLREFVRELLSKLSGAKLVATQDMKVFLGDLSFDTTEGTGQIRISTENKTYILDPQPLKDRLQFQILVEKLSK